MDQKKIKKIESEINSSAITTIIGLVLFTAGCFIGIFLITSHVLFIIGIQLNSNITTLLDGYLIPLFFILSIFGISTLVLGISNLIPLLIKKSRLPEE